MRTPFRLSVWQVIVGILVVFCAAGVLFLVLDSTKQRGPFWDKYEKLRLGMTKEEVEEILGPPTDEIQAGGFSAPLLCSWVHGQQSIWVDFNVISPSGEWAVMKKGFLPKTIWQKLGDTSSNP